MARALRLALTDPSVVFEDDKKLLWLRAKVTEAGGDPRTVDTEVQALRSEKRKREDDALSLELPGLTGLSAATIRCTHEDDEVGPCTITSNGWVWWTHITSGTTGSEKIFVNL